MTTINAYLTFNGNCKQAFDFYKLIFRGEFSCIKKFSDMPPQEATSQIQDDVKDHIMHISLPISKETILMGSDIPSGDSQNLQIGNNFSVCVNTNQVMEADRIFNSLGEEGKVTMPIQKTFWGAYFGTVKDKFGINWMVSCEID